MVDIHEIVSKIEFLPPIPSSFYQVLRVLGEPDVPVDRVAEMIQYDPSLSANILKLCQSPHYATRGGIGSLKQALTRIGFNEIRKMVLLIASRKVITKYYPGYEDRKDELWRHSISSALIAERLHPYAPETGIDLFTAAMLHDIGKVILSDYIGTDYEEIRRLIREKHLTFHEAEKSVLGTTHAEVGAMVLEKWKFQESLVTAVRFHHQPDLAPDSHLTHFVALSCTISLIMGFGTQMDGMAYKGFGEIYKKYGIREHDIERVIAGTQEKIREVESLFQ